MAEAAPIQPLHLGPSLADRVAEALRTDILAGRLRPGEGLPAEQAMATMFGVSRTVLREAISRLKAEGRVTTRQGLGAFVVAVQPPESFRIDPALHADITEVLRIGELRMGFEAEAAALAAGRRTAADLRELRAAMRAVGVAVAANDVEAEVEADIRLHRAISVASHNPYYLAFFNSLSRFLRENIAVSWRPSREYTPSGDAAQAEHRAIVEAIAARDPEAARAAARTHVANTAERISGARRGAGRAAARRSAKTREEDGGWKT